MNASETSRRHLAIIATPTFLPTWRPFNLFPNRNSYPVSFIIRTERQVESCPLMKFAILPSGRQSVSKVNHNVVAGPKRITASSSTHPISTGKSDDEDESGDWSSRIQLPTCASELPSVGFWKRHDGIEAGFGDCKDVTRVQKALLAMLQANIR